LLSPKNAFSADSDASGRGFAHVGGGGSCRILVGCLHVHGGRRRTSSDFRSASRSKERDQGRGNAFAAANHAETHHLSGADAVFVLKVAVLNIITTRFCSFGAQEQELLLLTRIVSWQVRTQAHEVSSHTGSRDLQTVEVSLRLLYRPDMNMLPEIFSK
jgi:hypothetical protein